MRRLRWGLGWARREREGQVVTASGRVPRWSGVLAALVVMALVNTGCVRLFPSDPFSPAYVVNRGGDYFAGDRCGAALRLVQVYLPEERTDDPPKGPAPPLPNPFWVARADPAGVAEYELFASDQPGVEVIRDDGVRPAARPVVVHLTDVRRHMMSVTARLDILADGWVATGGSGPMSWEEYMARPGWDYGCA